ncbi:hypothetical protein U1707_13690 [Sphingomonas sp. PB2P12]|uniref:hypothetical protein n=1 Tax=Sphingomonas sandaracina TaxID=3096157 RepID=UPI002FC85108
MGFKRLFRSRWAALLWSLGVLWTAYDVAGTAPSATVDTASLNTVSDDAADARHEDGDATGAAFDLHDLQILANAG